MFVCLSARISQRLHAQTSQDFLCMLSWAVARSSYDDNGMCYVLPVLWMTSCFLIMGPMACGVGNIYMSAVLKSNFQRIRQGRHTVWICRRIQWQQMTLWGEVWCLRLSCCPMHLFQHMSECHLPFPRPLIQKTIPINMVRCATKRLGTQIVSLMILYSGFGISADTSYRLDND